MDSSCWDYEAPAAAIAVCKGWLYRRWKELTKRDCLDVETFLR